MKTILTTMLLLTAVNVIGQEALNDGDVDGPQTTKVISLWQILIPVVVPLLVQLVRTYISKVPKLWLPVIAIGLGAIIDIILNLVDLGVGKGLVGAFMGAAAVGLREVVNETKKAAQARISS